jgi:hypothetical protein
MIDDDESLDDDGFRALSFQIYRNLRRIDVGIARASAIIVACTAILRDAIPCEGDPVIMPLIERYQALLADHPRVYVAALGAAAEMIVTKYGATVLRVNLGPAAPITYH